MERKTWEEWNNHTHCVGCDAIWKHNETPTCECADLIAHSRGE